MKFSNFLNQNLFKNVEIRFTLFSENDQIMTLEFELGKIGSPIPTSTNKGSPQFLINEVCDFNL